MAPVETLDVLCIADAKTGCVRWTGHHTPAGYGVIKINGKSRGAHVVAYERAYGPVPDGLEVDHVKDRGCIYRDCIEPTHLEAVTHLENVRRSDHPRPTHCPRGHEYTEANTQHGVNGRGYPSRRCRTCSNDQKRRARRG